MKNLHEIIIEQIRQSKTNFIPFNQFMSMALYYPELGYYTKEKPKIGKEGDFYTTPHIADVFAEIISDYCMKLLSSQQSLHFCEVGAGTGKFANSFLSYSHKAYGDRLAFEYTVVEQSKYHQSLIKKIPLPIHVTNDLESLPPFEGVLFANEWLDAIPIQVVTKQNGRLQEIVVCEEGGKLFEAMVPIQDRQLLSYLKEFDCEPKEGYRIEVPYQFEDVMTTLSQKLIAGKLILIDYMYHLEEWTQPALKDGSLRGYKDHQMKRDVLVTPGEMDITYHVPIEPLISYLEEEGFSLIESTRQDQFLIQNGILDKLQEHSIVDPFDPVVKRNRAIQSLISPSGISPYFHVLVFEK